MTTSARPGIRRARADGWMIWRLETNEPASDASRLRANLGLGGLAKLASTSEGRLELRVEIPDTDASCLREHERRAKEVFENPASRWSESAPAALDCQAELQELGREFRRGEDGVVFVPLEGVSSGLHVTLEANERWALRARLPAITTAPMSTTSKRALYRFLMRVNANLRLARTSLDGPLVWFEVCFEPAPEAEELDAALDALELAARWFYREARALGIESVARVYLDLQRT